MVLDGVPPISLLGKSKIIMSIEINYLENNNGVILDYSGDVTGDELIGVVNKIFNNDNFSSLKYWISDRTNCSKYGVGTTHANTIVNLTEINYTKNPTLLVALVSPTDIEYGMSRMYQALSEGKGFNTMVFHNRSEADEWISNELNNT